MLKPTIPPPTMTTSALFFMFDIRPRMMKRRTVVCSGVFTELSTENPRKPTFIADVMVGRLARWLRILGFDVLYSNRYEDDEILRIASAENRMILTRDTGFAPRVAPDRLIFIHHNDLESQVDEVLDTIGQRDFRML